MAALTVMVNPIIVLPAISENLYVTNPTFEEAVNLADEVVAVYETALGINFDRLTTIRQMNYVYYYYDSSANLNEYVDFYQVQYVSILDDTHVTNALNTMQDRCIELGGFMDLVGADNWPVADTTFSETMVFYHASEYNNYYSLYHYSNPLYMTNAMYSVFVRADASYPDRQESFQTGVIEMAGFYDVNYIKNGAGDETYSLKDHVGFTGNIESNKTRKNEY